MPEAVGHLPQEWFDRAYAARAAGFGWVCVYCGAGVTEAGEGEHAADCDRPRNESDDA
jgi:hypothetical protein